MVLVRISYPVSQTPYSIPNPLNGKRGPGTTSLNLHTIVRYQSPSRTRPWIKTRQASSPGLFYPLSAQWPSYNNHNIPFLFDQVVLLRALRPLSLNSTHLSAISKIPPPTKCRILPPLLISRNPATCPAAQDLPATYSTAALHHHNLRRRNNRATAVAIVFPAKTILHHNRLPMKPVFQLGTRSPMVHVHAAVQSGRATPSPSAGECHRCPSHHPNRACSLCSHSTAERNRRGRSRAPPT